MKSQKIVLSKTIKIPIPGVQYSNQVVSATIEYEGEGFSVNQAWDEINQLIRQGQDNDPSWLQGGTNESKSEKDVQWKSVS